MKILLVTDLYPIEDENISKALFYFTREWLKDGHAVTVIRPNFLFNAHIRGRKIIKEKIYYENGVKIYNLNFITPFLFDVRKKLPSDFSLSNYNVMISHMPSGALFALRLLEKENIKYINAVHASDITVLKDFKYALYFRSRLKTAYLKADKIAARSCILKEKIEKLIPETCGKTFTAYSGIEENIIDERIEKECGILEICTAASLIKRKNIDIIIKALAGLNADFHYTIIGEGSERKKLEKQAEKYGIASKITFTGHLPRIRVLEIMKKSCIFILLSSNETFGLVYLEAAAAGNIIIAKKNDGIAGLLKDGHNAFLINADERELAACLKKILKMNETEIKQLRRAAVNTAEIMTSKTAAENYLNNL